MSLKKVVQEIKRHKTFLVTAHTNLEADAVGSELALVRLLNALGKKGFIVNESRVPPECEFLPGVEYILKPSPAVGKFDCAVFLDCSEASRAGGVARLAVNKYPTLNIDHHISNTYFADVNWVMPRASSACEMVYRLYRKMKIPVDKESALCLYAGILVDTGSFRFNNTGSACHRIAASLIAKGVSAAAAYRALNENNPFSDIRLLSPVLATMKSAASGAVVWVSIGGKALGAKLPTVDLSELALTLMRSIKGVELAMVFKEIRKNKKLVRINFRSQTDFDCNRLASFFGGGGHKNASGATIPGGLTEIENKVTRKAAGLMRLFMKDRKI